MEPNESQSANGISVPKGDYWTNHLIQVRVEGPEKSWEIVVPRPLVRIGSHPQGEIVLRHNKVLRRHLYCQVLPEGLYCVDFQASQANEKQTGYWVDPDRPIQVGPYQLFLATITPRGERRVLPVPANDELDKFPAEKCPGAALFQEDQQIGMFRLRKALTLIGSAAGNRIRIATEYLSPFHGVVYRQDEDLWLIDLLSANQILVGKKPIDVEKIAMVGKVSMGDIVFKFRPAKVVDRANSEPALELVSTTDQPEVANGLPNAPPQTTVPNDQEEKRLRAELEQTKHQLSILTAELESQRKQLAEQQDEFAARQQKLQTDLADRESAWEAERQAWATSQAEAHAMQSAEQAAITRSREQLAIGEADLQRREAEQNLAWQTQNANRQDLEAERLQLEQERVAHSAMSQQLAVDQQAIQEQLQELGQQRESLEKKEQELAAARKLLESDRQSMAQVQIQLEAQQQKQLEEQREALQQQKVHSDTTAVQEVIRLESQLKNFQHQLEREQEASQLLREEQKEKYRELAERHTKIQAFHQKALQENQDLQNLNEVLRQQAADLEFEAGRKQQQLAGQLANLQEQLNAERTFAQSQAAEVARLSTEIQSLTQQLNQASNVLTTEPKGHGESEELRWRESEFNQREQQLQARAAELELERERLDAARVVFERESLIERSQFEVLANLHEMEMEKRWWYRLMHPFRRSKK